MTMDKKHEYFGMTFQLCINDSDSILCKIEPNIFYDSQKSIQEIL